MFAGLKDKASGTAVDKAVEKFAPALNKHLDKIKALKAADVNDDTKFDSMVIAPMLVSISGASGGVTKFIPKFDTRFKSAMYHVRSELIIIDGDNVKLVEDAQSKLPQVLAEGFKNAA